MTESESSAVRKNKLLAALAASMLADWAADLAPVELQLGQVLCEPGAALRHAYFPTTALVCLLHVLRDGATTEVSVIGCEGMVGVTLLMGDGMSSSRIVVQAAGTAIRLPAAALQRHAQQPGGVAMQLMLRYAQALIAQLSQTAACNRYHSIEQQLCRWMLLSVDRLGGLELAMTQEVIAGMLGVRREGVAVAAARLQRAGIIRYSRGRISVLDRDALERRSCECYRAVTGEYDRLLAGRTVVS